MSESKTRAKAGRRDFLKLASLATMSGGAALAVGKSDADAATDPTTDGGYRETSHVRTYYESARF